MHKVGACVRDETLEGGRGAHNVLIFLKSPTNRPGKLTKKSNAIRNTLKGSKRILMVDIFDIPLDSWSEDRDTAPRRLGKEK